MTGQGLSFPPHISEEIGKQWDAAILSAYPATRRLDMAQHPHLQEKVQDFARRLKIPTPFVYQTPHFEEYISGTAPNMSALPAVSKRHPGAIMITDKMFELFHYSSHLPVPVPLQAGLGHEMTHLAQGFRLIDGARRLPFYLGPIVGLAAAALLMRTEYVLNGKKPEPKDLETAAAGLRSDMGIASPPPANATPPQQALHRTRDMWVAAGLGVAGMAIGHEGGKQMTRQMMRHFEYQADAGAARLIGSSEETANFLKTLRQAMFKHAKEKYEKKGAVSYTPQEIYDRDYNNAHPDFEERIAYLKSLNIRSILPVTGLAI